MKHYLIKYGPFMILTLLVIPALLPLFRSGFFTMHDDQQVVRLFELDRSLAAGQFPARWVGNLGFGYGYPLFIFYPPFVYYLGEVFHLLLNATFIVSIKLVFAFAFFGAAYTMYLWAKEHFGKTAAIVAAAFYTYVPYHAVDSYVRGALAELTAFVWLPAILWSADRLIKKREKKYWIWLGVFLALLMITHNLIFLPFFPLFLFYVGFLTLRSKNKLHAVRSTLYAVLLALGLSAFFWLPALMEKKHTLVDSILLSDLANYKLHFVYPTQLWNSLWGYGGSTEGPLDGLSFKIGKLHIVLSAMAIILWAFITRLKRDKKSREKLFQSGRIFV
ncbi:glycosyltransferase family 39 protein [Patescibacteria group bacterium]|nr:glycosyltransferase family 39 protein [Patescibacteria group bacterium]